MVHNNKNVICCLKLHNSVIKIAYIQLLNNKQWMIEDTWVLCLFTIILLGFCKWYLYLGILWLTYGFMVASGSLVTSQKFLCIPCIRTTQQHEITSVANCLSISSVQFNSVQSLSCVRLFATPWIAARQAPCPSPTPGVYSNLCPSSRWCHPAISFSLVPFSSCTQSLPASGSFPVSHLFAWGGQNIGASASASVLPMNTQDWSL